VPTSTSADRRSQRRLVRRVARRRRFVGDATSPRGTGRLDARAAYHHRMRQLSRGDRPYLLALVGALIVALVLLSGPAQSYLDGRQRVETLTAAAAVLETENERLEQRVADLEDPEMIELLAREQQGLIRPGEVPYVLLPPGTDRSRVTSAPGEATTTPEPWWARAWQTVRDLLG
jgi:cell division protein FtsB